MESSLSAEQIFELGIESAFLATGSHWRRDGIGRSSRRAIPNLDVTQIFTPDDIMDETPLLDGPIVIYDDDQCYLGGVVADHLSAADRDIAFITPASLVSPWTRNTLEQERVQRSLIMQGVKILANEIVTNADRDIIETRCIFSGRMREIPCGALVLVTERTPNLTLSDRSDRMNSNGEKAFPKLNVQVIGDALAPGLIADAVYSGHLAARSFDANAGQIESALYRRELPSLPGT